MQSLCLEHPPVAWRHCPSASGMRPMQPMTEAQLPPPRMAEVETMQTIQQMDSEHRLCGCTHASLSVNNNSVYVVSCCWCPVLTRVTRQAPTAVSP